MQKKLPRPAQQSILRARGELCASWFAMEANLGGANVGRSHVASQRLQLLLAEEVALRGGELPPHGALPCGMMG